MKRQLIWSFALCVMIFYGCDSDAFHKVPEDNFLGTWEIVGRQNLKGIQIEIKRNDKNELDGRVTKLNDNKLVNMFLDTNEVFIKRITRKSNFQFELVEKKLGYKLFSIYGMDTDASFSVVLNGNDFISFSENSDDKKVGYKKVE